MTASSPGERFASFVRLREQINQLAQALLPSRSSVFQTVSLAVPNLEGPAELAFIRAASWLYAHYFEAGRVSVRFLVGRNRATGEGQGDEHLSIVHALRTWSQHNIDPTLEHDAAILDTCAGWFERNCGTRLPRDEQHWIQLLGVLLADAQGFLTRLLDGIGAIEENGDRDLICGQWEQRLKRDWPAHVFHELINVTAGDLGRNAIDAPRFYERHGHMIISGMKLLSDDCDLQIEARKLIERAMLTETAPILPITGADVLAYFEIDPGPRVGQLLRCARRLYEEGPCERDALLARMKVSCADV